MTFLDLGQLSPENLVAQYVLDCRNSGLFLPYSDYGVIADWMRDVPDVDDLLIILSEVLPPYFKNAAGGKPKSLAGARKLVLLKLRDRAMRQTPTNG